MKPIKIIAIFIMLYTYLFFFFKGQKGKMKERKKERKKENVLTWVLNGTIWPTKSIRQVRSSR
jgi:hypothetical protein